MARQEHIKNSTRTVAQIFLSAMDNAAAACDRNDAHAQYFLECLRDELAPQLKWAIRYGEWQLNAAPFLTDDVPEFDTEPDHELEE